MHLAMQPRIVLPFMHSAILVDIQMTRVLFFRTNRNNELGIEYQVGLDHRACSGPLRFFFFSHRRPTITRALWYVLSASLVSRDVSRCKMHKTCFRVFPMKRSSCLGTRYRKKDTHTHGQKLPRWNQDVISHDAILFPRVFVSLTI